MDILPGHDQFFAFRKDVIAYIDSLVPKWSSSKSAGRFSELLDYTTDGGKCLRGLLTVYGFLELTGFDPDSPEAHPGYVLGWAQEILQASFLVADDIMDKSQLRRGKPCWHIKDGNGYIAVSDSYFLENAMYPMIDHYFAGYDAKIRRNVKSLLHETTLLTAFGQYIDMSPREPTIDNWKLMVTHKTSYYSIWQPFISGICASGRVPEDVWRAETLKEALLHAGRLFQCHDDWLDLYGNAAEMGKVGRDIQDGKISWLFAKAIELASDEQKVILKDNIGQEDQEAVDRVKQVYTDLNIDEVSRKDQNAQFGELEAMLSKVDGRLPKGLVATLLKFLRRQQESAEK